MSTVEEIHVGDVGVVFRRIVIDNDVAVDISTATLKQFIFRKPGGTIVTKTAVFTSDGTDGELQYISITNDLNEAGLWKMQTYLEMPSGKFHSTETIFNVAENLS